MLGGWEGTIERNNKMLSNKFLSRTTVQLENEIVRST